MNQGAICTAMAGPAVLVAVLIGVTVSPLLLTTYAVTGPGGAGSEARAGATPPGPAPARPSAASAATATNAPVPSVRIGRSSLRAAAYATLSAALPSRQAPMFRPRWPRRLFHR